MKLTAAESVALQRAAKAAPDLVREFIRLGFGEYAVIDAKGRYWLCVIQALPAPDLRGRGSAHEYWTLVPVFGPVHAEGTFFQTEDEAELIDRVTKARRESVR